MPPQTPGPQVVPRPLGESLVPSVPGESGWTGVVLDEGRGAPVSLEGKT